MARSSFVEVVGPDGTRKRVTARHFTARLEPQGWRLATAEPRPDLAPETPTFLAHFGQH